MVLEYDLLVSHARIRKGFFLNIHHHDSDGRVLSVTPRGMGLFRITHSPIARYAILKSERVTRRGVGTWLRTHFYESLGAFKLTKYK
jgi:hypothetical protein